MRTRLPALLTIAAIAAPAPAAEPTVVIHADVAKLLATPFGKALDSTPNWIAAESRKRSGAFGLTPADLTTVDLALETADKIGVSAEVAAAKPFARPRDRKSPPAPVEVEFVTDKLMRLTAGTTAEAVKRLDPGPSFLDAALAPRRLPARDREAIRQNFRGGLEVFAPLLDADRLRLQFSAGDDESLVVTIAGEHADAAKRAELNRVLERLLKVATTVAVVTAADTKTPSRAAFQKLAAALKTATVAATPAGATLTLTLPRDFPFTAILPRLLGLETPATAIARGERGTRYQQIALAFHNYEGANQRLPAAATIKNGKPLLSWRVAILPFLDQVELYRKFKLDEPWDSEHNKKLIPLMPAAYAEPAGVDATPAGTTRAQVFVGRGGIFEPGAATGIEFADIPDGMSNTILVACAAKPVTWTKPDDLTYDPKNDPRELLYFVNDATAVAFCDGWVRRVERKIAPAEWRKVVTRNDGLTVTFDDPQR